MLQWISQKHHEENIWYFPYKRQYMVLILGCRVYIFYIMINSTTLLFNDTQSAIGAIG